MALEKEFDDERVGVLPKAYWKLEYVIDSANKVATFQAHVYKDKEARDAGRKPVGFSPVETLGRDAVFESRAVPVKGQELLEKLEEEVRKGTFKSLNEAKRALEVRDYPAFDEAFSEDVLKGQDETILKRGYQFVKRLRWAEGARDV